MEPEDAITPDGPAEPYPSEPVVSDKPKRGRKPKHSEPAPEDAPVEPESLPPVADLPTRSFRCRIPKCHTRALEDWTEVEAVTPADAKEAYLTKMGIVSLSEGRKVEVEAV